MVKARQMSNFTRMNAKLDVRKTLLFKDCAVKKQLPKNPAIGECLWKVPGRI